MIRAIDVHNLKLEKVFEIGNSGGLREVRVASTCIHDKYVMILTENRGMFVFIEKETFSQRTSESSKMAIFTDPRQAKSLEKSELKSLENRKNSLEKEMEAVQRNLQNCISKMQRSEIEMSMYDDEYKNLDRKAFEAQRGKRLFDKIA